MKAVALVLNVLLWAAPALSEVPVCTGAADALAQLSRQYAEELVWQGLAQGDRRLLVTANPDGSTWTAMIQHPDGKVCFIGAGQAWGAGGNSPAPKGTEG